MATTNTSINNSPENVDAQQRLRTSINHLTTFEDEHECEQFIRSLSSQDRIVLIVSGRLGQNIVPRIHQLRQISSIYVYCFDKKINEQWAKQFTKVRGVIVQLNQLIVQIQSDQTQRQQNKVDEPLAFTTFNSSLGQEQSTSGLNGQFVHSQLLIDCLLRLKPTTADTKELISLCKEEYKGNDAELAIVREFEENYSSDRSLWWYTRESFLYRTLNKALRVQNIDLLFLFRFVIVDLGQQLKQHWCSSPVTVYRGQMMSKDELELLKQSTGELISFNSFLSTSLDRDAAVDFLTHSTASDDLKRVLFKIDADPRLLGVQPFANITSLSYFPGEEEILFMLGSIFRIANIDHHQNGVWIIRLALCSDRDHDLKPIIDHLKNEGIRGETNLISFGNVLQDMGKFNEAEKFYRRRLNQLPSNDHRNIAECHYSLGSVADDKGDYDSSLECYNKSLEIRMRILKEDDPDLANTHNCIAIVYRKKDDYQRALESHDKALVIFKRAFGENHLKVAMCYDNMGIVYKNEKKYSKPLDHYAKALIIRQKYLPAYHPHLGTSHNNIGNVHRRLGHSDQALKHLHLSLKIKKKSLPPHHPSIAITHENIGIVYEQKKEWKEALSYYEKAATTYRHSLPPSHPHVVQIEEYIQRVTVSIEMNEMVCRFDCEDMKKQ